MRMPCGATGGWWKRRTTPRPAWAASRRFMAACRFRPCLTAPLAGGNERGRGRRYRSVARASNLAASPTVGEAMSKVIVIAGAGSGLGRALARRFAADGDSVVLLGRTLSKLERVAAELGPRALPIACDIGDPAAVKT